MKDNYINKLAEETLSCMDNHKKACAPPYLLTRIHARLLQGKVTVWDRISSFITRPVITVPGLVILIVLNLFIISSNNNTETFIGLKDETSVAQGFNITEVALYDVENVEP